MKLTVTALSAAALAVGLTLAPVAQAADTAVFLGGTGTGYVPAGPTAPPQFTDPFVPGPHVGINHIYNGAPWVTPQSSVAELNALIATEQAAGNQVTLIGLSKGAQVAQAAIHAEDAPAPGTVTTVLLANPDRDGGLSTAMGWRPEQGETRQNVVNVYGQYDGFADWPDRFTFGLAEANALMGIAYVHYPVGNGSSDDILTKLDQAEITVEDNLDADGQPNGTTSTEIRVPTKHLPLTRPLRDISRAFGQGTDGVDQLDRALRPMIDRGYSRNDDAAETSGLTIKRAEPGQKVREVKKARTEPRKAGNPSAK